MLVLKNCRLVEDLTEDYTEEYGNILIENGLIQGITQDNNWPENSQVIDCEGKTVLPGFFEMHSHLCAYEDGQTPPKTEGELLFGAYRFAAAYLKAGYTTVRDCGSLSNTAHEVKKAIKEGILQGPRLLTSGLILTPTEKGNDSFPHLYCEADSPEEFRKACRRQLKAGNDFIKLMVSGAFLNEGGNPGERIITEEELQACVEAARRKNTYVCAHCHDADSIKRAVLAGVGTVEHGVFIDQEAIDLLRQTNRTYLVPTGAITVHCYETRDSLSDNLREKAEQYYDEERECLHRAYRARLTLGFGSDLDYETFVRRPGLEFTARKEYYGFADGDILKQATIDSARILGLDDKLGTVAPGKLADLVVVEGRPEEDIHVLRQLPALVLKDGKVVR